MKQNMETRAKRWWIVLVAFYGCLLFSGCTFFAFSLFVKPLQASFGWDRSAVAAGFTFLSLAIAFSSPFVGKAVDRLGPKQVMCFGAAITAAGYGTLFFLNSSLHFYLSHLMIGIGGAAMGPVPCSAIVTSWFDRKRGLAIGLMSTGIGVGGFVFSPFVGGYVIPHFGWRIGYASIGVLAISMLPLAFWVIEPMASAPSVTMDDQQPEEKPDTTASADMKGLLLSPTFLLIASAFLFSQFSLAGTVQSQVPHLEDIGFSITAVATALGGVGIMSALGKLLFGWLCDRIPPKYAFSLGVSLMLCASAVLIAVTPDSSLKLVWVYSLCMGLGAGSWLPSMSMLVSRYFGMAAYGSVFGAVTLVAFVGVSTGPLYAGYIFDVTGSYRWAFMTFLLLFAGAIPAMISVRK